MAKFTDISRFGWALVAVAGLCAPAIGRAQDSGLQVTSAVFQDVQVKTADGSLKTERVPAATVVPGTEVIYQITYRNTTKSAATDIAINNPVPKALAFTGVDGVPASAVSVDDGSHYGKLPELTVSAANGATRPARPEDITNLRWIVATLAPGAQGSVSYRARVK
jgi:uncharacterized repeat protein (TIGR01451 family)